MKKTFFVVLLILLSFQLLADDDKLRLAVMEFEDRSGEIPKKVLQDATEYLRGALISANKYIVIAQERQSQAMVKDMKKESYKECNDKNCQIQLGQALSADTILRTTITRLGNTFVIASELIDLEKEATVVGAREKYDGTENSMSEALDNIAEKVIAAYESIQNEESSNSEPAPAAPVYREQPRQQQASPIQSRDERNCEQARKEDTISAWETYLRKHPQGVCSEEAQNFIDEELCYKAREKRNKKEWEKYLEKSHNGKCAEEAKNFLAGELSKKDMATCEKARNKSSEKGWKEYLEEFPEGQCAAEAKAAPDNIACNEAKKDGSLKTWKEYLNKYPEGKCSVEAKQNLSNKENIERLTKKGRDMKIAGATLFAVGAAGFSLGFILGATVPIQGEDWDGALALGWGVGGGIGGTMILIGLPIMIVGILKEKEAKSYLEINNLAVVPTKGGAYAQVGFNF